jgi:hypothetical protein
MEAKKSSEGSHASASLIDLIHGISLGKVIRVATQFQDNDINSSIQIFSGKRVWAKGSRKILKVLDELFVSLF